MLWPRATVNAEELFTEWGLGAANAKGRKRAGDDSLGQDNYSVARLSSGWEVFCVCDGHGRDGHWPAQRVAQTLPQILASDRCEALLNESRMQEALETAFELAQLDLEHRAGEERKELFLAGTTLTVALQRPDLHEVHVASAGDSRAVLIDPELGAVQATRDHRPDLPEERARIEASNGEVHSSELDDGTSEARVYEAGTNWPGLAMSRSLGDLAGKDIGVICTPTVVRWPVRRLDEPFLLLASDGLWEVMTEQQVTETVRQALKSGKTSQEVCQILIDQAIQCWELLPDVGRVDDVTAMLVPLRAEPGPLLARDAIIPDGCDCVGGLRKACTVM